MGPDVLIITLSICLLPVMVNSAAIREDLRYEGQNPCITYLQDDVLRFDCSYRGLVELPENLTLEAQVLDLSYNNFMSFPPQLELFTRLEKLDMTSNYLTQPLPPYFKDTLTSLRVLNLSSNYYDSWFYNGGTSSIRVLDLSKNKISTIEEASILGMENLNYLDLSENRIEYLSSRIFARLTNLETLILSRNYFSDMPAFESPSLKSLQLSSCQINYLKTDSFSGMTSLLVVDLSINQIESIPDNLASNTLQELDLSYNAIGSITDRTFSSLPDLAVLNLRGNEFKEVWSTSYFASNQYLREIHVKGNRWSCEGFSVNLLLTYEFLIRKAVDSGSLICYSPANVTQMTWQQAYLQTWHLSDSLESFSFVAIMIGIIIGVVITSFVCRSLMAVDTPDSPRAAERTVVNLNGMTVQDRAETVVLRVPLHEEDLPPSYDEALLMPRLNSSFHSLPDFVDEYDNQRFRRSRSIGDLTEHRPRTHDRRSVRRTVEININ